jgi:hypothetical protein
MNEYQLSVKVMSLFLLYSSYFRDLNYDLSMIWSSSATGSRNRRVMAIRKMMETIGIISGINSKKSTIGLIGKVTIIINTLKQDQSFLTVAQGLLLQQLHNLAVCLSQLALQTGHLSIAACLSANMRLFWIFLFGRSSCSLPVF